MHFAAECLRKDAKNYHVWAHRQAVLVAAGVSSEAWAAEAALTTALIHDDARNNSVWAQRAFILNHKWVQRPRDPTCVPPAAHSRA